jgi:hypothetical protein
MKDIEQRERPQWKEVRNALDALVQHLTQDRQAVIADFRREVEDFSRNIDHQAFCSLEETTQAARELFHEFHAPITHDALGPDLDRFDDVTEALLKHAHWFFAEQALMKKELAHIRDCMTTREDMVYRIRELIALHGKRRYEGLVSPPDPKSPENA